MFAYFKGNIEKKHDQKVVVDVNGIGYEIYMSSGDIDRLTLGETVKIHTFTDIKEGYIGMHSRVGMKQKGMDMFTASALWAVDMYVILRDNCNLR